MISGLTEAQCNEFRSIVNGVSSVKQVVLFGSRASGKFSPASDVDIALVGNTITLEEQIDISARLNENSALLKFDVVRYSTITNPKLIEHIKAFGMVVYER